MQQISLNDVSTYVENNIGTFHQKRIASLDGLSLTKVLKRKNPYLFKAKYVLTAEEIIRGLVDAHISSNEETIFGDWLEGLAIFINGKVYGGWKSGIEGIDLEFDNNGQRFMYYPIFKGSPVISSQNHHKNGKVASERGCWFG